MRKHWNHYFLDLADQAATRSTCDRRHVGCVLVRDHAVVATGYNGSVRGQPHCDNAGHDMLNGSCVRTVHAEANAVAQAARTGAAISGAVAYVNTYPCWPCYRLLANAGVARIVFRDGKDVGGKGYTRDPRIEACASPPVVGPGCERCGRMDCLGACAGLAGARGVIVEWGFGIADVRPERGVPALQWGVRPPGVGFESTVRGKVALHPPWTVSVFPTLRGLHGYVVAVSGEGEDVLVRRGSSVGERDAMEAAEKAFAESFVLGPDAAIARAAERAAEAGTALVPMEQSPVPAEPAEEKAPEEERVTFGTEWKEVSGQNWRRLSSDGRYVLVVGPCSKNRSPGYEEDWEWTFHERKAGESGYIASGFALTLAIAKQQVEDAYEQRLRTDDARAAIESSRGAREAWTPSEWEQVAESHFIQEWWRLHEVRGLRLKVCQTAPAVIVWWVFREGTEVAIKEGRARSIEEAKALADAAAWGMVP